MASGYLQGGDTYQILDADHWAGQTFRAISSFILQWVDLNLKLTNRQCEPLISIFAASPAHLPVLPELSHSRYWLINQPLPTRDWLFHEPWGKSLSENHPWQENGFLFDSYTSFNNSQITIFNDAHGGENISHELPATLCPLVDPDGKHLYLHHHSPYASGSPTDAWFSYYLQTFKGAEEYLIEPLIDRGTLWGAWGTYASATATVYAFDHGKGPTILDITSAWIEGRTLAGLNNDPTDWYLKIIRIANEQFSTLSTQLLINNFLGIAHQQYKPVPDNDYDTLPPLYTWPNILYRVRFSMSPVELNPDTYYFMRVSAFPTWPAIAQYWQYDKADSTYPSGIRLSSDNAGVDWTEHHGDDHLFSAFGTPISPPPPPDPPLPNWAIITVSQILSPTGYTFIVWTNVPCHLYMFWTDIEPEKHERTRIVRGLAVADAIAYCFVTWHQNEQLEPGDTILHTFVKEPWPVCETRWFTFRALVNNDWSPSAGPIFKKHRKPGWVVIVVEPWTENDPTTDWDFYYTINWTPYGAYYYTTGFFVSPPTCIQIGNPNWEVYALSKHSLAQDLKAGRISCWARNVISGVGDPYIYIGVTGPGSHGIRCILYSGFGVWKRTQFTWSQGKDNLGNDKTVILCHLWDTDHWVYKRTDYEDPMTGDVNRVGIGATPQSIGWPRGFDDTIIEIYMET